MIRLDRQTYRIDEFDYGFEVVRQSVYSGWWGEWIYERKLMTCDTREEANGGLALYVRGVSRVGGGA